MKPILKRLERPLRTKEIAALKKINLPAWDDSHAIERIQGAIAVAMHPDLLAKVRIVEPHPLTT